MSASSSSSDASRSLNAGERRSTGVPTSSASARSGAAVAQRRARRAGARGTAPRCWPGTAAARGTTRSPRRASRALGDRLLDVRPRDLANARKVVSRLHEQRRLALGGRRDDPRRVGRAPRTKRGRGFVSGLGQVPRDRAMSRSSGRKAPIAWLMSRAAAGERVAEPFAGSSASRRAWPRRTCSRTRRTRPARAWPSRAGSCRRPSKPSRRAAGHLDVLEAERGARPDDATVESHRQRLDGALQLQLEHGDARAVVLALAADLVDDADARAADPHLVAAHEVRRRSELRRERVCRHERQALVRVVREEHGDEDDEHRRRADQHRVAAMRCAPPLRRRLRTGSRAGGPAVVGGGAPGSPPRGRPPAASPRAASGSAADGRRRRRRRAGFAAAPSPLPRAPAARRGRRGAAVARPAVAPPRGRGGLAVESSAIFGAGLRRAAPRRRWRSRTRPAEFAEQPGRSARRVRRARVDDQPGAQVVAERVEAVDRGPLEEDVVASAARCRRSRCEAHGERRRAPRRPARCLPASSRSCPRSSASPACSAGGRPRRPCRAT